MPWSEGLEEGSPAYRIAVSTNSRIRALAGPGSGKSFALKRRVARLLEASVEPLQILPVTFTRVAAEDLHRELVSLAVPGCDQLRGRTLHSLGMSILMRRHVFQSTGRVPRPLNLFELRPLHFDLAGAAGGLRDCRKKIQAYEAGWARLQHEEPGFIPNADDVAFNGALVSWLRFHQGMLIGEIIPHLYDYLKNNPAAAERGEYSEIMIDEYQDLNKAEQEAMTLLAGRANICIVGDDDQSIYSFKYAHPEGIRNWCEQYQGSENIQLAECRRCPTRVIAMANSLIARNQNRDARNSTEMRGNGEGTVRLLQFETIERETSGVARLVAELIENGSPPGDILILAQRGVVGTPIFNALEELGVPVKSYYAESELETPLSQEAIAYFKLSIDPEDRIALRWLLGHRHSSFHNKSYARIRHYCEATGTSPWAALNDLRLGNINIPHTGQIVARYSDIVAAVEELRQLNSLPLLVDELFPDGVEELSDLRGLAQEILLDESVDNPSKLHGRT